jgi:hypothetical protein
MRSVLIALMLVLTAASSMYAQFVVGTDTLYGNEWIQYSQSYYKIKVADDRLVRVPYETMVAAGIPMGTLIGDNFQLFLRGQEVPIYVSNAGLMGSGDYIEFYGYKNRGELDSLLYVTPKWQANPMFSSYSDTSVYFLTWNSLPHLRVTDVANDISNPPSPEPYCIYEELKVLNNIFHHGPPIGDEYDSFFKNGEGFAHSLFNDMSHSFSTLNVYSGATSAVLEGVINAGYGLEGGQSHNLNLVWNGTLAKEESFAGGGARRYLLSVPIVSSATSNKLQVLGTLGAEDKYGVGYLKLTYQKQFKFGATSSTARFRLPANAAGSYFEVPQSAFGAGTSAPLVIDLTNNIRLTATLVGTSWRVMLPPSSVERSLLMNGQEATHYTTISQVEPVSFVDFSTVSGDYIILSHSSFIQSASGYVQAYANYRATTGYTPLIVDIQQVYDQFGYGIRHHPLSVVNFSGYSLKKWALKPKFMFVIGKSRGYHNVRLNNENVMLICSYGSPPSDNLLTSTLNKLQPRIAIGRLPVKLGEEIRIERYLTKVKQLEAQRDAPQTIDDKAWMKRVLHLGGGDPTIQYFVQASLNNMKPILEAPKFGGDVYSFFKTGSAPIQIAQSAYIDSLINGGVSLITFFGHSATNSFDFSLDSPNEFENYQKYPLILSLGCFSGQIHSLTPTISEDFVFAEEKGAIAFIASLALSESSSLAEFAQKFYRNFSYNYYEQGVGEQLRRTVIDLANAGASGGDVLIIEHMTLNGDPAVSINAHEGPDYVIDPKSLRFDPTQLSNQMDDFELSFDVLNLGSALTDSFNIQILRELPDGTTYEAAKLRVEAPLNRSAVVAKLTMGGNEAVGLNKLYITLDFDEEVAEKPNPAGELNNKLIDNLGSEGVSFFVFSDDIIPIYPSRFGIVPTSNLLLKASTITIGTEPKPYYFEIDTTEYFNSPLKKATVIASAGGLLEWKPNIPMLDSTVYYWRVQVDPSVQNSSGWQTSSFIYINGEYPGWNQSHIYQVLKDRFVNIKLPESTRKLKFIDDAKELRVRNGIIPYYPANLIGYDLNNHNLATYKNCSASAPGNSGVYITVFDPVNIEPLENSHISGTQGQAGSVLCSQESESYYMFPTDSLTQRERVINFLNTIQDDSYVLFYTLNDYKPQLWGEDSLSLNTNLFQVLEGYGATQIRNSTQQLAPYIFFFKKGDTNFQQQTEIMGTAPTDTITADILLFGSWDQGNITSTLIGPAVEWGSLHWQSIENTSDSLRIELIGVKTDDSEVILNPNVQSTNYPLTDINANEYPYLRLKFYAQDELQRTCPHLNYWRVLYKEIPEAVIRPDFGLAITDSIQQGQPFQLSIPIENITYTDMDSLVMHYTLTDENNVITQYKDTIAPLLANDTLRIQFGLNTAQTRNLININKLLVDANPIVNGVQIQREQEHFNNIAFLNFKVYKDLINPLMDVTFDGVHMREG